MSETKSLLEAMLAVQAEAPTLPRDGRNPHFNSTFTPLDTIVETIGPILGKHGLVWMTKPGADAEGRPVLFYTLAHAASGEREEGAMPLMLTKEDPQGQGSAITYARRYTICAVLNLVADDDDDGHAAGAGAKRSTSSDTPTAPQMKELARQVRMAKPSTDVLREMLKTVEAKGIEEEDLVNGLWSTKVNRAQVSGLLGMLKECKLPTGQSDIPNDSDPAPEAEPGDPLPFEEGYEG